MFHVPVHNNIIFSGIINLVTLMLLKFKKVELLFVRRKAMKTLKVGCTCNRTKMCIVVL